MKKFYLLPILILIGYCGFAQSYEVYVCDAGNFQNPPWQILKFDSTGQNPTVFINSDLNWPQDILFLEDSNVVLISNFGSNRINVHDGTTGNFKSNFATSINGPTRIKIGADGLLYVLQWNGNGKVRRYELNGNYLGEFTSVGVPQSIGLDWDSVGNLYVSSYYDDLVRKFDTAGNDLGLFIDSNLVGPTNIWFDKKGDLLVLDYDGNAVKRFDPIGNYKGNFITGVSKTEGLAFFPNGDILIGNGATSSVKMYDNNGMYLKEFVPSGSGNLINPNGIALRKIITTGVSESSKGSSLYIFPNPTTGQIQIKLDEYKSLQIKVINSIGNVVLSENVLNKNMVKITFPPSVAEGVYLMHITRDDWVKTEKIILKR